MLNAQIDEKEKTSSTKGMTLDEMIAQVGIFSKNFGIFIFSSLYSLWPGMRRLPIQ